jgi:hypothetical protein
MIINTLNFAKVQYSYVDSKSNDKSFNKNVRTVYKHKQSKNIGSLKQFLRTEQHENDDHTIRSEFLSYFLLIIHNSKFTFAYN